MAHSQPKSVESHVLDFMRQHGLTGSRLVVAVSGGPDSVCLLHALAGLKEELNLSLHVAHLDHQLRGEESAADAAYVANLAASLGLPCSIEARDVRRYRAAKHLSLEEAARVVRYDFLAAAARAAGASGVAVGHTRDDNLETILLHLVRGTGTRGLRGLEPVSGWQSGGRSVPVYRPLLEVTRAETMGYCQEHGLAPRTDSSNFSPAPLRNQVRHRLLPLLREYNAAFDEALLRTARIAADELSLLDFEARRVWKHIVTEEGRTIALDRHGLTALHPALKRHMLRMAAEQVMGRLKDIEARHIEEMLAFLDRPAGRRLDLPHGLVLITEHDRLLLGKGSAMTCPLPPLEGETALKVPGETLIPGWKIQTEIVTASTAGGRLEERREDPFTARLDGDAAGTDLVVRAYKPGDRFQPLGMHKAKKVARFMIDEHVPQSWRRSVPVLSSPTQVLWLVGYRIDDRVKITPATRQVLCIRFVPLNS